MEVFKSDFLVDGNQLGFVGTCMDCYYMHIIIFIIIPVSVASDSDENIVLLQYQPES